MYHHTIELIDKYLRHDIQQITRRMSVNRFQNGEARVNAMIGDEESDDQLLRRLVRGGLSELTRVVNAAYQEVEQPANGDTVHRDNKFDSEDDEQNYGRYVSYVFHFKFQFGNAKAVASAMHWFVVRWAVCQWAGIHSPQEKASLYEELKLAQDSLTDWLWRRPLPVLDESEFAENTETPYAENPETPYAENPETPYEEEP